MDIEGEKEQYEEYTWAGQTKIWAASLLDGGFSGKEGVGTRGVGERRARV